MSEQITEGVRVAFRRAFLRDTGQITGWVPFARGVVSKIDTFRDFTLVTVRWDDRRRIAGEPAPKQTRVNINNLVLESRIHLEPV